MEHVAFSPEMDSVRVELLALALGPACVCGAPKARECFCDDCGGKLARVDWSLDWYLWSRLHFRPNAEDLLRFDVCVDLLRDPKLAEWKPSRRKKEED